MELNEANLRKVIEAGESISIKCDGLPLDTAHKEGCWVEVMPVKSEIVLADCEVMFRVCTPQYQSEWKVGTLEDAGMFAHKTAENLRNKKGGAPKCLWGLLDACGINRNEEWIKHLEIKLHDLGDGEGPQEIVTKDTFQQIMEHCRNKKMKIKLKALLVAF